MLINSSKLATECQGYIQSKKKGNGSKATQSDKQK
jgi:hypothetical protein